MFDSQNRPLYAQMYGLAILKQILPINDQWIYDSQRRAKAVALYRKYYEGEHRQNLTDNMKAMLRVTAETPLDDFCDNYCGIVVDTMGDRLNLIGIDTVDTMPCEDELTENSPGDLWVNEIMKNSRFDSLQTDHHTAVIRDGGAFIFIDPEPMFDKYNPISTPVFIHEPAYNGYEGMLAFYASNTAKDPTAVIKIWNEVAEDHITITQRINIYFPDRIEKYSTRVD
jgi:hypothetical protein